MPNTYCTFSASSALTNKSDAFIRLSPGQYLRIVGGRANLSQSLRWGREKSGFTRRREGREEEQKDGKNAAGVILKSIRRQDTVYGNALASLRALRVFA
jgi:hypothetical protein